MCQCLPHEHVYVTISMPYTKVSGVTEARKRTKKNDKETSLPTKDDDDEISTLLNDFDPEEYYRKVKTEKESRKRLKEDRLR